MTSVVVKEGSWITSKTTIFRCKFCSFTNSELEMMKRHLLYDHDEEPRQVSFEGYTETVSRRVGE